MELVEINLPDELLKELDGNGVTTGTSFIKTLSPFARILGTF
ncbi:MAG TPA: hypothetical protein VGA95_11655 [Thermodesulfobacteriota bacterium]